MEDEPREADRPKLISPPSEYVYEEPEPSWARFALGSLLSLLKFALFLFALFVLWAALHYFFGITPAPCNIPGTSC